MASRFLASVCFSALGLSVLLAGFADPPAVPTTFAATRRWARRRFRRTNLGGQVSRANGCVFLDL